ncbi:ribonuclease III [Trypanosoma rangeli]|uniref:Ribonuclease III n=1 Tax=Trypanosoma rangeli TaxID=5698 RepID=A0A422NFP6_TRYRA|nr:ribonuclease III [Trypanosoma rangeli]RNF04291.1 ribonuclease III [Trypanosoma rangeli]|eukprot:RNF04291.1 ribonuclease III [Trypanosoma rangeli]
MRRTSFVSSSESLVNIVSALTEKRKDLVKLSALLASPSPPLHSLSFAPPPRWAAELSRRLQKQFPELQRQHHVLYMRAFIHPSFTTPDAVTSTMSATTSLGEALLAYVGGCLIVNVFRDLKRDEVLLLMSFLLSDATLSSILRYQWEMDDMLLTDASVQLFQGSTLRSTAGLLQWLSSNGKQQTPDPYSAGCVKSLIGAVYLDGGLEAATSFIYNHILQNVD